MKNLYDLAVAETKVVLREFGITEARIHRMSCAVVDNLVAKGVIQSTDPANLVPGDDWTADE